MNKRGWMAYALALLFIGGSAMAQGGGGFGGGQGGRGGVSSGKQGKGKGNKNKKQTAEKKPAKKWPLPEEESVSELDPSKFEQQMKDFKEYQVTLVDELKQKIEEKRAALAKTQSDARAAYERASDQKTVYRAAQQVMAAVRECKQYDPNKEFTLQLKKIAAAKEGDQKGTDDLKGLLK